MLEDRWFTDYEPDARWQHYTRANAGEVMPSPVSPLCQKFTWDEGIIHGAAEGSIRAGLYEADEYDPVLPQVFGFFGGHFYLNLSNIRMQGVRNPAVTVEQLDLAFFGDHSDVPPYVEHPEDVKDHLTPGIEAHLGWIMTRTEWPELMDDRAKVDAFRNGRPDLTTLSDAALLERARSTQPDLVWGFNQHYMSSSSSGVAPGVFGAIGEAIGDPTIPMKLVSGMGDVDSAAPSYAIWDMSRTIRASEKLTALFDDGHDALRAALVDGSDAEVNALHDAFAAFLHEYGSRGPNEWEISAETWETNPRLVFTMLDSVRRQADDQGRHAEAGNLSDPAHIFMLVSDELDGFVADPGSFKDTLAARYADWLELDDLVPPFIIADGNVPALGDWERKGSAGVELATAGTTLSGVAGCPGVVRGRARVILDPSDPMALEPGDIMIAPNTDPGWTPLFMTAAGVVVNVGGQISHAIIVSRELALPCVVSVENATELIPDGALVEVDGDTGQVTVVEV